MVLSPRTTRLTPSTRRSGGGRSLDPQLPSTRLDRRASPGQGAEKGRGLQDARAELFDGALEAIRCNRPLAFVLEESDRLPSFQGGEWWREQVTRMKGWGYEVFWKSIQRQAAWCTPESAPAMGCWAQS